MQENELKILLKDFGNNVVFNKEPIIFEDYSKSFTIFTNEKILRLIASTQDSYPLI